MKPCKQYEELIPLYLVDGLDTAGMLQVKKHIGDCEACRQYQLALSEIAMNIRADEISVPENYGAELVVKLNRRLEKRHRRQKRLLWTIPAFSSVAAMIVITLINIIQPNPNNDQWLKQFHQEHSYVSLSDVGYFGEFVVDDNGNSDDDLITSTDEMSESVAYEIISESSIPEIDRYLMATSNLDDSEFQSLISQMQKDIL